jgi:hypothetical protein
MTVPVPAPFINVAVTVTKSADGSYVANYDPPLIPVKQFDTVINFQIVSAPENVGFKKMDPQHTHQLSDPSRSVDRMMMTLSDINTVKEVMNLKIQFALFTPGLSEIEIHVTGGDPPDLSNDPPPGLKHPARR